MSRDTGLRSRAICFISSILVGLSVALLHGLCSSQLYFVLRFTGGNPLEAQGLWFFLGRCSYVLGIIVIIATTCTSLTKRSVCFLHWLLFLCYGSVYLYLRFNDDLVEPTGALKLLLLLAYVISLALQTAFFFMLFDVDIPGGYTGSTIYVLAYLFGSGLSGCIMILITINKDGDYVSISSGVGTELGILFTRVALVFAIITFFSSALCSYVNFNVLDGPCREYLTLSVWDAICIPFNGKCLYSMLFCSLAWLITPLCGIMTCTFLFNMTSQEKASLERIQQLLYMGLSLALLTTISFCLMDLSVREDATVDFFTKAIGDAVLETDPESAKKMESPSDKEDFSNSIGKRVLRDIPSWCLLPYGFWNTWEARDNDMATFIQQCITFFNILQSLFPETNPKYDGVGLDVTDAVVTYKDVMAAKHCLLTLLSKFIVLCDTLGSTLKRQGCFINENQCKCAAMKNKMDTFVSSRGCVPKTWTDWDCSTACCPTKSRLRRTSCHMCGQLLACVNTANNLIRSIRKSSLLRDDTEELYMYQAFLLLEKNFMSLLVLLFYYQLADDWIVLCNLMDDIQSRCMEAIDAFTATCSDRSSTGGDTGLIGHCGCKSLIKLALCCQTLHRKQCEIASSVMSVTSSYANRVIPCSSHSRSLMLLVSHFVKVSKSFLATDRANRPCCQSREEGCGCCRYSGRLDCILSKWLSDVSTSVSYGDEILREAISLVSYVAGPEEDTFRKHEPEYFTSLRAFFGLSRRSSSFASALYNITNLFGNETNGTRTEEVETTPTCIPNVVCASGQQATEMSCECLIESCGKCENLERNTFDIVCYLSYLCDNSKLTTAFDTLKKVQEQLKCKCEELEKMCCEDLKYDECIDTLCSEVKKLFASFLNGDSSGSATVTCKCKSDGNNCCCDVPCLNKELANSLLYLCCPASEETKSCPIACNCQQASASAAAPAASASSNSFCTKQDCKSLACVLKKFVTLVTCKTKDKEEKCSCCTGETGQKCISNGGSLKQALSECCDKLCELETKIVCGCQDGKTCNKECCCDDKCKGSSSCTNKHGLLFCVMCVFKNVTDICNMLCCMDKGLGELEKEYCKLNECIQQVSEQIHCRYDKEAKLICELKKHLDENGAAYASAFACADGIVSSLTELSDQHRSDMFSLSDQVNHISVSCNKLCDRAKHLYEEHLQCVEGLEAERYGWTVSSKSRHHLLEGQSRNKVGYIVDTINTYMWYFDAIWTMIFMAMFYTMNAKREREDWVYVTNRNMSIVFLLKGAMMTFSYFGILCMYNRHQGYLLNISIILGYIWAVLTSWICQWYIYEVFLGNHSVSIWKWYRLLHPTSGRTKFEFYRRYRILWAIVKADLGYVYRFLKGGSYAMFSYNPYNPPLSGLTRYNQTSLTFSGVCDWRTYERNVVAQLFQDARNGVFTGILDYVAFNTVSISSLGFLFDKDISKYIDVPRDLLFAAWKKKSTVTVTRSVIYNLLEKAFSLLLERESSLNVPYERAGNIRQDDLNHFSREQQKSMASKAMDIALDSRLRISETNITELKALFESYYQWKWHSSPRKNYTSLESIEESFKSFPSEYDRMHKSSWLRGFSCATYDWREATLKACNEVYDGSEECKTMVTRTADEVMKLRWSFKKTPTFHEFIEGCKAIKLEDAMEAHSSDETRPLDEQKEMPQTPVNVYQNLASALKLELENMESLVCSNETPEATLRRHDEVQKLYEWKLELHRYFLGEWLRRMYVYVGSSDVKQIMELTVDECKLE